MHLDPVITGIIQNLTTAVVMALVGVLVYASKKGINLVEKYVAEKIGVDRLTQLKELAMTFVKNLEQSPIYKDRTSDA
jgi:hypothetical protein